MIGDVVTNREDIIGLLVSLPFCAPRECIDFNHLFQMIS